MTQVKTESKFQGGAFVGVILLLCGITVAAHQFKVPMIMGDIAGDLLMTDGAAGWLMNMFVLTGIVLALPAGALTQKLGPKNTVFLAALIMAFGSALGALSPGTELILVSRAIEGTGFIIIAVAGPMAVITHSEPSQIGRGIGIWATWVPIGQVLAFNLTPIMIGAMSWQVMWYIFAALSFVTAFIVKFALKTPPAPEAPPAEGPEEKVSVIEVFKDKNVLFGGISFATFCFMLFAMIIFFVPYALERGIMTIGEAAFVASIPMIGSVVGSPLLGLLSEKIGRKKLYILSILATGVGVILFYLGLETNVLIYVGAILTGLIGLACPAMILGSMGEITKKPSHVGVATGIVIAFQNLGFFAATLLWLTLVFGLGGSMTNFFNASLLAIPVALIGAFLASRIDFK